VLFDRAGSKPGQLHGRSPHMQSVHVPAHKSMLGQIAPVRIEDGRALSLTGALTLDPIAAGMVA
jgi:tRNA-2-methylthio-N6-dimethylallyladenosine synthase